MLIDYDKVASRFDDRYRHQPYAGIRAWLHMIYGSRPRRMLDVGCGTGHWLTELSSFSAMRVGLDRSYGMVAEARQRSAPSLFVCGAAEELPFAPRTFHGVFCVNAFHHFTDRSAFLENTRTLLGDGGSLAVAGFDPHHPSTRWYLYEYFEGTKERDVLRYPSMEDVRSLIVATGFSDVTAGTVEHIQKTFADRDVLGDAFLVRESTSQLLLLDDAAYRRGLRSIEAAVEAAERSRFEVDLWFYGVSGISR